jgi:SAM-dependent methyltransferase
VKLDVGCGTCKLAGFVGMDAHHLPGVDIVHDLTVFPWPIQDQAVEQIWCSNVIEHLPDTVATMNEFHRIAKKDCRVFIIYPHYRSFGSYGDPTHVHFFNENMIEYFLEPGTSTRLENRYAFYTQRYWRLTSRKLSTYPFLRFLPDRWLSLMARHFVADIVHSVELEITPVK